MNTLIAQDIFEYIRSVEEFVSLDGGFRSAFFRGQGDESWKLEPSGLRNCDTEEKRKEAIDKVGRNAKTFKRHASSFLQRNINTNLEWLFLMQHHGLPTTLLDWTLAPLNALFFCISQMESEHKKGNESNGAVWVLSAEKLNEKVIGKDLVVSSYDKMFQKSDSEYLRYMDSDCLADEISEEPKLPLAISPVHVSTRITAQSGCFTLHGKEVDSIVHRSTESEAPYMLTKLVIPREKWKDFKNILATFHITNSCLFPDLDGLAKELGDDANWYS